MSGVEDIDKAGLIEVVPATREFLSVDAGKCDGCGNCVVVCPMDLWKLRDGKAAPATDYKELCMECGTCFIACPPGAVEFDYPPAGTGIVYRYS